MMMLLVLLVQRAKAAPCRGGRSLCSSSSNTSSGGRGDTAGAGVQRALRRAGMQHQLLPCFLAARIGTNGSDAALLAVGFAWALVFARRSAS